MPIFFCTRGAIAVTAFVGALLASPAAWPLTLGEPSLVLGTSGAWVAELPLRGLKVVRLDDVKARLAPASAWALAQMQAPDPKDFQLSIVRLESGPTLRIESSTGGGFIDLLIELQWPRGRLLREIGLLLDPGAASSVQSHVSVPGSIGVQSGDTAGALALSHLDAGASLSQALLALQQANPDAFLGGNINRLRAGATLKLPDAEQIKAVSPDEAREAMAQQMEEYAQYRSELAAQSAPGTDPSQQVASGKVQLPQRDKVQAPGDRLTLSAPETGPGDQIAAQREAQQTAQRAAELNRNIQELNRVMQSGPPGDSPGLASPLPLPAPSAPSGLIDAWAKHPNTPWAALALVLLLAAGISWRALRRPMVADTQNKVSPALKVDFDLNLPGPDSLPPLPESVHRAPTPVVRASTAVPTASAFTPGNPMAGLSLELTDQTDLPADANEVRWELIQALWQRGMTETARVLARELQEQAPPEWSQCAHMWLDERA
ncbi:MAG: FimV/HubP family polar landmark protein [Alphaproteobacteria bacterium]|nr:FimV/HubP family polar landmark protein [Alphaproteobacteria bacterium]